MQHRNWLAAMGLAYTLASPVSLAEPVASNSLSLLEFAGSIATEHFDVRAARAEVEAALSRREAASQPLYNPQLEFGAESGGEQDAFGGGGVSLFSAGISQTIDWNDKREVRTLAAKRYVLAAEAELALVGQEIAAQALDALINYRTTEQLLDLARRRVEVLQRFAELAQERKRAGDIGQTDLDLARLALAEGLSVLADARVAVNEALQALREIATDEFRRWPELPDALPAPLEVAGLRELAKSHPQIAALQSQLAAARAEIDVARSQRQADPTVGAGISREGENNIVGLSFSIPLYVRNDYRAEVDAAANDALAVEASMQAEYERLLARLRTTLESFQDSRSALQSWQKTVSGHLDQGLDLLERLWQVGELSATEYLLQIQQRLDARAAGLRLRAQVWRSWTNWLVVSGDWRTELSRLEP